LLGDFCNWSLMRSTATAGWPRGSQGSRGLLAPGTSWDRALALTEKGVRQSSVFARYAEDRVECTNGTLRRNLMM
jgi:hypothetical protein